MSGPLPPLTEADVQQAFAAKAALVSFAGGSLGDRPTLVAVCNALAKDPAAVTELRFDGCGMGYGLSLVLATLTCSPGSNLRALSLRGNLLGPLRQCGFLGQYLAQNVTLQRLDIAHNQLAADLDGTIALFGWLKKNPRSGLLFLDAGDNGLQTLPALPLEETLNALPHLFVNLNANPVIHTPEMGGVNSLLRARHQLVSQLLNSPPPAQAPKPAPPSGPASLAATVSASGAGTQIPARAASFSPAPAPAPAAPSPPPAASSAASAAAASPSPPPPQAPAAQPPPAAAPPAVKKPPPICDGCRNPVAEFQYRCLTCPRFRFCTDCYNKHSRQPIHDADHSFVGMEVPA